MMAALTFPQDKWRLGWLSTAGRKYATYIYIFTLSGQIQIIAQCYRQYTIYGLVHISAALILSVIYVDVVKPLCSNIANRCIAVIQNSK